MKTIETLPNRLSKTEAIDATSILDVIIGHRLRGKLVEHDLTALRDASPDRLSLFLLCGAQLLYPLGNADLPLETILSSEKQNPHGFYLHSCMQTEWSVPQKGVYHTAATPDAAVPYTIGLFGAMYDLQTAETQNWLHRVVESLHRDVKGMSESLGRILVELSEPGLAVLFSNSEGSIVTANPLACEIIGKSQIDMVGADYQSLLIEPEIKNRVGKNKLTSVAFGSTTYTLISLAAKQETTNSARYQESITFLFQLLRDKVAVCDIASDLLSSSLAQMPDTALGDIAQTLAKELHDLRLYVERSEMLVHNRWNVVTRQNLCALVTIAADKSRSMLPRRHEIRTLPFEENIYHPCSAQGIDTLLETVIWLHLHEHNCLTHTSLCLTRNNLTQIDVTTTSLTDCRLHEPKIGWTTYLQHLGQELNLHIETVQNDTTSAITTYIQFGNIKE